MGQEEEGRVNWILRAVIFADILDNCEQISYIDYKLSSLSLTRKLSTISKANRHNNIPQLL